MNFLLDENFPPAGWKVFSQFFHGYGHEFGRVGVQIDRGFKDIELFNIAHEKGYNAIITSDINQIHRQQEREACKKAQLHWIGIPRNHRLRGRSILHNQIAQVLGSLDMVIKHVEDNPRPTAFLFQKPSHDFNIQKDYPQPL